MTPTIKETNSQLIERFASAWRPEESRSVDRFLADHPEVSHDAEVAVRLIYEDFCLRQEAGCQVDPDEILKRFPQWRTNLEVVLDFYQLVRSETRLPCFPTVGPRFC